MIRRFRRCCKCCKLRVDFHIPGFGIFDLDACVFCVCVFDDGMHLPTERSFFCVFFWVDQ